MVEPLSVDADGVRSLGDIHTNVAAGLESLSACTPGTAGVAQSHGAIAHGVSTALAAALNSRSQSMNAARSGAETFAELLREAADAYERGDQAGGAQIKAAAEGIGQGEGPAATI